MEISVFDEQKKVAMINCKEIEHIKRVNRRFVYKTARGVFHSSNSLEEEALLRVERDFRIIDKNSLINMDKVEDIKDAVAYINGTKYPISTRRIKEIMKYWFHVRFL